MSEQNNESYDDVEFMVEEEVVINLAPLHAVGAGKNIAMISMAETYKKLIEKINQTSQPKQ